MAIVCTLQLGTQMCVCHAITSARHTVVFLFFNHSHFGNLKPLNVSILMRFPKGERERKKSGGEKQQGTQILFCFCVRLSEETAEPCVGRCSWGQKIGGVSTFWFGPGEDQFLYADVKCLQGMARRVSNPPINTVAFCPQFPA